MKKVRLGSSDMQVSAIVLGCMRMNGIGIDEAQRIVETALECGINFFDHADIYAGGECEKIFGEVLKRTKIDREEIFIQSKCGIVPGVMFDSSKEHILKSVDDILKRLDVEYIDSLLIHRPDALVEPEEVAEAFDKLEQSGKVRYFGVSNQKPMQIELLKKYVKQPIIANQLQLSIAHAGMIGNGFEVNMLTDNSYDRDGSVLDYCRLHDITLQAWSPFQYGFFDGVFIGSDKYVELNSKLESLAAKYGVTSTTIAVAWLLRHPANMQVVVGTMNKARLEEIAKASKVELTREEWYAIYMAAGNILP